MSKYRQKKKKTRGSYGVQVLKFNLDESTETLRFLCYLSSMEKDNKRRKRDKRLKVKI